MNERRRMMSDTKTEPLIVFKEGDNRLTNGEFTGPWVPRELDGVIVASYADSGPINIRGIDFTKYKKLCIECWAATVDYDEYYTNFYIGYGTGLGAYASNYTAYEYAPPYYRVVTLDISNIEGSGWLIKASAWVDGTANVEIKNIWLE